MKKFLGVFFMAVLTPFWAWAGENVTYTAKGEAFEGYRAKSSTGPSKGMVIIVHDWDGLTDYEKKRADMLASMGYDAFAIDLFGKGKRPKAIKDRRALTKSLYTNRSRMRALLVAGYQEAKKGSRGKTVMMGYCFGGAATLEMARSGAASELAGYVSFHGGLATPPGQSYPPNTAPLLIAHGGADKSIPMDDVAALSKELETAKLDYEIQVYSGAPHAFTVFGSKRYREKADQKSWVALKSFLKISLGG